MVGANKERETPLAMPSLLQSPPKFSPLSEPEEDDTMEMDAPQLSPTTRVQRPKASGNPPSDHLILADEDECRALFYRSYQQTTFLHNIRSMEVHLDASKLDEYAEYRFAAALTKLHPRPNGTNPHNLQTIRLIVKGNLLFARYSYHLVSPKTSSLVGDKLKKLVTDSLSGEEEKQLPYKINSMEKGVSKALLGLRRVRQVFIEGKGHMEADFAATIKATLPQPPGADIVGARDNIDFLPFSTHLINRVGEIVSEAYGTKARRPYPTITGSPEYAFSRLTEKEQFLVDEKTELVGHLLGLDDYDARAAAKANAPGKRGVIPTVDVGPVIQGRLRTRGEARRNQEVEEHGEDEDPNEKNGNDNEHDNNDEDDLNIRDMVWIKEKKVHPEDIGFDISDIRILPVILTSKEGTVELGWKM